MSHRPERRSSASKYQSGRVAGMRSWRTGRGSRLARGVELLDERRCAGGRAPRAPRGRAGAWRGGVRRSSSSLGRRLGGWIDSRRADGFSRGRRRPRRPRTSSRSFSGACSVSASTSATSSRGPGPRRPSVGRDVHEAGAGIVLQAPGPHDRPVEAARGERGRRRRPWRAGTAASPRARHPGRGPRSRRRSRSARRRAPRPPRRTSPRAPWSTVRLRSGARAGPGARREHDRVGAADVRRDVVALEIAEHRRRRRRPRCRPHGGVADQAASACGRRRASSRIRRRAICPWPPAIRTSM